MRKFVLAELDRRFKQAEFIKSFAVATILDPRFKKIYFQSSLAASQAITFIASEMKKDIQIEKEVHKETIASSDIKISSDSLWSFHDEHVKTQQNYHTEDFSGSLPIELRQYLNRPILSRGTNIFDAWETMKTEYPMLYKQAMYYLPLIATSVPSERLFSEAQLVLSDLRSRLTPTHFSQLLFLASISAKLWFNE